MATSSPLLKLVPIPLASIPTTTLELTDFVSQLLTESLALITKITSPPQAPWHQLAPKGDVELFYRDAITHEVVEEHWFARRSVHPLEEGLKWEEFKLNLLDNHAENEADYIPTLKRVDRIQNSDFNLEGVVVEGWTELRLDAYGTHYALPFPLSARVFPILLLRASSSTSQEFVNISIPITIAPETTGTNGQIVLGKKVVAQYAAVEWAKVADDTIIWTTGTASDAGGNLPMSVQRRSIPGQIAKDVPLFLNYLKKKRT